MADTDTIIELAVGDDAAPWSSIGFAVDDDDTCLVGEVRLRFVGAASGERGIVGWTLTGGAGTASATAPAGDAAIGGRTAGDTGDIDGLPTATAADAEHTPSPPAGGPDRQAGSSTGHPNGVSHIDHVVIITPDLERTTSALEQRGIGARRTREAGRGRLQRFFRLGEVVVELVGPAEPAGDGPAAFWGLAFTVADIDATAHHLAGRIGEPRDAVQQGRRIATLRVGDEVSVPVAFMSATDRAGHTQPRDRTGHTDRTGQTGPTSPGLGADGSR
jgi:hypothetical protein